MTCSVPDCGRVRVSRGWCSTHYNRWKRTGDAREADPVAPMVPRAEECAFDDCWRKVYARTMCTKHYQQQRLGEPLRPVRVASEWNAVKPCGFPGCDVTVQRATFCGSHMTQKRRTGTMWPLGSRGGPPHRPVEA